MDISIFDIVENGVSNSEISDVITEKLKEKYNEEFAVKMIGNRYGTAYDNTVTTYCFPRNNENLLFTAIMNKEQSVLEDDYYLQKVTFELEENIRNEFTENNINTVVKTEIIGLNKLEKELSVQEFIKKYNTTNFISHIICQDNVPEDILKNIYNKLENKYKNIHLKTSVYFIDKNKFEDFFDVAKKMPSVTNSIISEYAIKDEKIIKIFEGKVNIIK